MSATAFVVKPTTYVCREGTNDPRVLYHQEPVCGTSDGTFHNWLGVAIVRLPEVDPAATELNEDGTIPWAKDAKGQKMFRDREVQFPIPNIDGGCTIPKQIHNCLAVYDQLARECSEGVSKEYEDAIKKWRDTLGINKKSKLIVPGMGAFAGPERQVDDNGETIKP